MLLYPEGMVKLPGSSGEIMKRIDGKLTVRGIVADLQTAFPGTDLRGDVIGFPGACTWKRLDPNQARRVTPLWLLAEVTYKCPLHCVFCYNPIDYTRYGEELSTDDWLRVLRAGPRTRRHSTRDSRAASR